MTTFAEWLNRFFPHEDVKYLGDVAKLFLSVLAAIATLMYITKGGRLINLSTATANG